MKLEFSPKKISSELREIMILAVTQADLKSATSKATTHLGVLNALVSGHLAALVKRDGFSAKDLSILEFPVLTHKILKKILLVGWNPGQDETPLQQMDRYRRFGAMIQKQADRAKSVSVAVAGIPDLKNPLHQAALTEGMGLMAYTFDGYKSKQPSPAERKEKSRLQTRKIIVLSDEKPALDNGFGLGLEMSCGTALARDLVNTPPCDCTPDYLLKSARMVAQSGRLELKVWNRAQLKKLGANALLAVAQGSNKPPYLIKMTYRPKGKLKKVISIVGKGITFDSGGLCIKTASGMDTMKMDMGGAAAVIGAMQIIGSIKPAGIEVRAYVPTCENMTGEAAMRPGDVVTAVNGKTIEILNTDAEGRLILADALSLAVQDKADTIIDLATLTGACVVALGGDYAGLFTPDKKLATDILEAGDVAGERFWQLPLPKEYFEMIKSSVADIKNTGGRSGGAITAALFLREFATIKSWAHLDIAGPAFADSEQSYVKKGGVGFGVRTLVRYILGQVKA